MYNRFVTKLSTFLLVILTFPSCHPEKLKDSHFKKDPSFSKIIGGEVVDRTYAKNNGIVAVYDHLKHALCTGSLIENNLVLTAAHCINVENPNAMMIFFGADLAEIANEAKLGDRSNIRTVTHVKIHENYGAARLDPQVSNNDIALIEFSGTTPEDYNFAKLAAKNLGLQLLGSTVTVSGFGVSDYHVDPVTGTPTVHSGSGVLRTVNGVKVFSISADDLEISFDQSAGYGACHGDSGGPAYFEDLKTHSKWLIGLTSRDLQGECRGQNIFTDVIGYSGWIQENSALFKSITGN